jgi:hypothetical protein
MGTPLDSNGLDFDSRNFRSLRNLSFSCIDCLWRTPKLGNFPPVLFTGVCSTDNDVEAKRPISNIMGGLDARREKTIISQYY